MRGERVCFNFQFQWMVCPSWETMVAGTWAASHTCSQRRREWMHAHLHSVHLPLLYDKSIAICDLLENWGEFLIQIWWPSWNAVTIKDYGPLKSHSRKFHLTEVVEGAGKMARWWQAHTAHSGDLLSIAGTHFAKFTTTYGSSSRGLHALFWTPYVLHSYTQTYRHYFLKS